MLNIRVMLRMIRDDCMVSEFTFKPRHTMVYVMILRCQRRTTIRTYITPPSNAQSADPVGYGHCNDSVPPPITRHTSMTRIMHQN